MTLCSIVTLEPAPGADAILAVLTQAMGEREIDAMRRVLAPDDCDDPGEGLALLEAHLAITGRSVRQAILDVMVAIAGTGPRHRARGPIAS